jgi:hypothetical protein
LACRGLRAIFRGGEVAQRLFRGLSECRLGWGASDRAACRDKQISRSRTIRPERGSVGESSRLPLTGTACTETEAEVDLESSGRRVCEPPAVVSRLRRLKDSWDAQQWQLGSLSGKSRCRTVAPERKPAESRSDQGRTDGRGAESAGMTFAARRNDPAGFRTRARGRRRSELLSHVAGKPFQEPRLEIVSETLLFELRLALRWSWARRLCSFPWALG